MSPWKNLAVADLPPSGIRVIYDRAVQMVKSGRPVYQLSLGRPDMDTPLHIKDAAIAALKAGKVHYAPTNGIPELRQAIADTQSKELGWSVNPDTQVLVTVGASEALFAAMTATLNPGDEVLIGEHCWVNYPAIVRMCGAHAVFYRMPEQNGFEPDLDDLHAKVSPRTTMLILNSPNNPTGAVFSESTIRDLSILATEKNLLVLSDECYRKLTFSGVRHVSPASLPGMSDRTIVVDSFSKTYSMTGWRLGYVIAPTTLMPNIIKSHQYNCGTACSFGQFAAAVALTAGQECVSEMQQEFERRQDLVSRHLRDEQELVYVPPKGTFYAYPRLRDPKWPSMEFSLRLLEQTGVAVVPGSAFGPAGEGHFRISYTLPEQDLTQALKLLSRAISASQGD